MLSLDIDAEVTELQRLKSYFNLKYAAGEVQVTESSSHDGGYHFVSNVDLPVNQELLFRQALGDDKGRIRFSEMRADANYYHDILFLAKKKKGKGWQFKIAKDEANVLSLPFKLMRE